MIDRDIAIWALIQRLLFVPYRWGGDDPLKGYDCSGGVLEILISTGLHPNQDNNAQGIHDFYVKIGRPELPIGSKNLPFPTLAFFGASRTAITHIGICINDTMFFEFGGGGSKTKTLEDAERQNAYGRIRPLSNRRDLVSLVSPLLSSPQTQRTS